MEWEIPELINLNEKFRQNDRNSPYYTGYGAGDCYSGSSAVGGTCGSGLAADTIDPTAG